MKYSDPTVRLDLAPSLNWLSRRSVLAAIHSGQLTVEPMQFTTLLEELAPPNIPTSSHHTHIVCALCGMPIYSTHSDSPGSTPTTPNSRSGSQSASWSTALFKNVRAGDINISTPFTGNRHSVQFSPPTEPPSQLYIFRLEATSSGLPVSLPISSQQPSTPARQAIYPLCTNGWCLGRLRTTCSLWAFVRTSIVEKIWEEPPITHVNGISKPGVNGVERKHDGTNGTVGDDKPPTTIQPPPRRSKIGLGSLWGTMQRSLSGAREPEKETGKAQEPEKKEDTRPKLPPRDPSRTKGLPPPPPSHPSVSHAPKSSVSSVHRVPPPFHNNASAPAAAPPTIAPPPLPKRNRGRDASVTPEPGAKTPIVPNGDSAAPIDPASTEAKVSQPSAEEDSKDRAAEPSQSTSDGTNPTIDDSTTAAAATEPVSTTPPKPELTVPASISRATSNDSFSTPTEELSPGLDSTPAATTVPLPGSQEPSPEAQEQTSSTETIPSTEPSAAAPEASAVASPPEVTTPVPPTAAAVVSDEKPPSRTGSPAPPPLPRRAAARQRPSSVLVPQATEQPKRDSVDAAPAAEDPTEQQPAPTPAPTEEPVRVITEEPQPIDDAAVSASVPHPEPNGDAAVPEVPPAAEEQPRPESESQPESSPPPTEPHVDGDAKAAEIDSAAAAPDAPATDASAVVNGDMAKGDAVTASEPEPAEEQDNGLYVGDATWEERTYKELMRLREEMFWARIGAVVH